MDIPTITRKVQLALDAYEGGHMVKKITSDGKTIIVRVYDQSRENDLEEGVQYCNHCNQKVSYSTRRFDRSMVTGLIKMFEYCCKNKKNKVAISDLDLSTTEYTSVNHLVRFGLAYKSENKAGIYELPMTRVNDFLSGRWKVAAYYITDPTKSNDDPDKRVMSQDRILIDEVPNIKKVQEDNG